MAPVHSGPQIFDDANRAPAKSSVFRAIMSKPHKRNHSSDDAMASQLHQNEPPTSVPFPFAECGDSVPGHLPLGEIVPNREAGGGYVPMQKPGNNENKAALHKKTKSAVSLKSLRSYMERKSVETPDETSEKTPKKSKSSNSLSAILKRSQRGRKGEDSKKSREKENRSPTDLVDDMQSPVWSQTPAVRNSVDRPRQNSATDRHRSVADEVSLYTPKGYGPAQQRNFLDHHQPCLTRSDAPRPRPKSDFLAGNPKPKEFGPPQRTSSGEKGASRIDSASRRAQGSESPRKNPSYDYAPGSKEEPATKRLSRVQAAISAFNAKGRDAEVQKHLDSKDLESEFEKLLVGLSFHP